MEDFDWKQIMKTTFLRLKILGLWPEAAEGYTFGIYALWSIVCIGVFTFGHPFFQAANILFTLDDLQMVVATIYVTLTELLIVLKTYYIIRNMRSLKNLIANLEKSIFQPKNSAQIELIQPGIEFWKKTTFMYWSMGMATVFFMSIYPIVDNSELDYKLPFLAWYPYDTRTSPNYQITYLYQVFGVVICANTGMSADILVSALFMCIGAQFDILCDNITHLCDDDQDNVKRKLMHCVQHHRAILKFAEHTAQFSNWIIVGQFFISAISIGLTMFELTTVVPFSNEFFSFLSYLCSMAIEIFIYCWFGNEVEIKSSKVTYAMFKSDWIKSSSEAKKLMIILVERCKKPLKISALNLFYLSLETFVKILRAAWSYFALLHQLSSRK